jgi:ComF family protein
MHWLKKLFRGYNQSELLAIELAHLLKIPCKKSVVRVKLARQQALLNRQARIKNIKNIFKLKNKFFSLLANKHILIVDDVFTTGSTFKEMARQLHSSDVASITIISIARG